MYESVQQNNNPFAKNIKHVKDYFKSPIVLIMSLLSLITLVFTIISSVNNSSVASTIASLLYHLDVISLSDANDLINNVGFNLAFSLPAIVMGLLTVVGYILIFAKSRTSNPNNSPNAGFSLCYAASVIQLITNIISCVGLVIATFASWISYIDLADSYYISSSRSEEMLITCIVATTVYVLLVVLLLSYAITQLNFFRALKNSINGPILRYEGAKGFAVSSIIYAVLIFAALVFLIIYLSNLRYYKLTGGVYLAFTLIVISMVTYIFQAVIALGYRSRAYSINSKSPNHPQPSYVAPAQPYATPYAQPYPQQQYGQPYPQLYGQPYAQQPVPQAPVYAQPVNPTYAAPAQTANPTYTQPKTETYEQPEQVDTSAPTQTVSDDNTCPQCGTTYEDDSIFCESCGYKLK